MELVKIELLVIFREKLTEKVAVSKVFFEVTYLLRELDLIVEPSEDNFTHCAIVLLTI